MRFNLETWGLQEPSSAGSSTALGSPLVSLLPEGAHIFLMFSQYPGRSTPSVFKGPNMAAGIGCATRGPAGSTAHSFPPMGPGGAGVTCPLPLDASPLLPPACSRPASFFL